MERNIPFVFTLCAPPYLPQVVCCMICMSALTVLCCLNLKQPFACQRKRRFICWAQLPCVDVRVTVAHGVDALSLCSHLPLRPPPASASSSTPPPQPASIAQWISSPVPCKYCKYYMYVFLCLCKQEYLLGPWGQTKPAAEKDHFFFPRSTVILPTKD